MERRSLLPRPYAGLSLLITCEETIVLYDDPALVAIAAITGDALPERLWRYDTATADPVADLAQALHSTAIEFTGTTQVLARALAKLGEQCQRQLATLTSRAALARPHGLDTDSVHLVQLLERHDTLRETLLASYTLWRRHRPASRDPRIRYLLTRPYDPTGGVLTLATPDDGESWLVCPDAVAAAAYDTRFADRIIGQIHTSSDGWRPTAYTHPEHQRTCPHLVYPLPAAADEAAACRSLLRWWALRDSPQWGNRTPDQLSTEEQAALAA
jgi:hypothetical protein